MLGAASAYHSLPMASLHAVPYPSIESTCIDCSSSLQKIYVKTVLSSSTPAESIEVCKELYGPPEITFVADVSGSMAPSMSILKNSVLALLDMAGEGSFARVLTFDDQTRTIMKSVILTKENIPKLKEKIKEDLINYGGSTNLQEAIRYCLLTEKEIEEERAQDSQSSVASIDPHQPSPVALQGGSDPKSLQKIDDETEAQAAEAVSKLNHEQITLFASDGLANSGLTASHNLLTFARTFDSYFHQTFYTLGIKLTPFVELNSELLKDMALDSGGSFKITSNSEGIAEFLGDVLAHHYFVRFTHMRFKCESQNGKSGTLCTKLSMRGGILRADKPLELVWEFPCDALPPFTLHASMKKRQTLTQKLSQDFIFETVLHPQPCEEDDIEKILGCSLLAPAVDRVFSHEELTKKIKQLEKFIQEGSFLGTLQYARDVLKKCLDNFGGGGEQTAEDSMHSYAMSSGGGAVMSVQAEQLRSFALQATQAQEESFDSQKTVESESNKRQKKN